MAQLPMYAAMVNSPGTELAADINATATSIEVLDASKLPDAPNLVTIGIDETSETILYTGKIGNTLTECTRGFEANAKGWTSGTQVARNHTAYDYESGRYCIADLNGTIDAATSTAITNTIVKRDANARFKAAAPLATDDVARKAEVDAAVTTAANDATAKANAAQTNAQTYVSALTWQKHQLTQSNGLSRNVSNMNADTIITNGDYVGENIANAPSVGAGQWWYIRVSSMASDYIKQEAMNVFNNTYQTRTGTSSSGSLVWGSWTRELFAVANLLRSGSGSPEGVVTAPIGTLYLRTEGSTTTTLYVKTSGTGNTGWTAK